MEVLSEEYTESAFFQAIGDLVAEISFELQKSIRSSKLKTEEDEENNKNIKEEDYLQTVFEFNKVNLSASIDTLDKK